MGAKITIRKAMKFTVNGVEYDSLDQLPPELRDAYRQAVSRGVSVSLTHKPSTADALPPAVQPVVSDPLGSAATRRSAPLWIWAIAVAALAALITYLLQRGR